MGRVEEKKTGDRLWVEHRWGFRFEGSVFRAAASCVVWLFLLLSSSLLLQNGHDDDSMLHASVARAPAITVCLTNHLAPLP